MIALAAVLLGSISASTQEASPAAQAYAETDAKFREIKDNVATAKERLDNVNQQLERVENFLKANAKIAPRDRAALMRQLGDARNTLQKSGEVLETFGNYADKVTQAADAVNQVRDLYAAIRSDRLSDQVRALGAAMEKYGGGVLLIGHAIEAYGKITTGLVEATDKLDRQIGETFRQDQIGSAVHGGKSDPRYKKLVEQFGKDFADKTTYAPDTLREVFRPVDKPRDAALIWDQEAGEWYRVDGNVPVETIFGDVLKARGKRPTPTQLKQISDDYNQVLQREAMAEAIADLLRTAARPGLAPVSQAFTRLGPDGSRILQEINDPDFRARFVYDGHFRSRTLTTLDAMRRDLMRQGRSAARSLGELDALLAQHGIRLESQTASAVSPGAAKPSVTANQACLNECVRQEWICQQKKRIPGKATNPACAQALASCQAGCGPQQQAIVTPPKIPPLSSEQRVPQGTKAAPTQESLPMTGDVRSTAWRPNNPGYKWGGVWHIKDGQVTAGDNVWKFRGHVQRNSIVGTWTGPAGKSTSGTATFHPGGKLTFVDEAGPGVGTWEIVTAAAPEERK